TGTILLLEAFLGSVRSRTSVLSISLAITASMNNRTDLPIRSTLLLGRASISTILYPPASPHRTNERWWYRNFHLLSIAYAFRPQLRSRLTLSGRTFLRNP